MSEFEKKHIENSSDYDERKLGELNSFEGEVTPGEHWILNGALIDSHIKVPDGAKLTVSEVIKNSVVDVEDGGNLVVLSDVEESTLNGSESYISYEREEEDVDKSDDNDSEEINFREDDEEGELPPLEDFEVDEEDDWLSYLLNQAEGEASSVSVLGEEEGERLKEMIGEVDSESEQAKLEDQLEAADNELKGETTDALADLSTALEELVDNGDAGDVESETPQSEDETEKPQKAENTSTSALDEAEELLQELKDKSEEKPEDETQEQPFELDEFVGVAPEYVKNSFAELKLGVNSEIWVMREDSQWEKAIIVDIADDYLTKLEVIDPNNPDQNMYETASGMDVVYWQYMHGLNQAFGDVENEPADTLENTSNDGEDSSKIEKDVFGWSEEDDLEVLPGLDTPAMSRKNSGLFAKLSQGAKDIFSRVHEKSLIKKEGVKILDQKRVVESLRQDLDQQKQDLENIDEDIANVESQIKTMEETYDKIGDEFMTEQSRKELAKEREVLEQKISDLERKREDLPIAIEFSEANLSTLEEGLSDITENFYSTIERNIRPYKEEVARLQAERDGLLEDKEEFEGVIEDLEERLQEIRDEAKEMEATDLPESVKKSFRQAIDKKLKDADNGLRIARSSIDNIDKRVDVINSIIDKENRKIGKWTVLDTIGADQNSEVEQPANTASGGSTETVGSSDTSSESESTEDSEEDDFIPSEPGVETPEAKDTFPVKDYLSKWNTMSFDDDSMSITLEDLKSNNEVYASLQEVEDKIRGIVFSRAFDKETEKRGRFSIRWWFGSDRAKFEKELSAKIDGKLDSLKSLFR